MSYSPEQVQEVCDRAFYEMSHEQATKVCGMLTAYAATLRHAARVDEDAARFRYVVEYNWIGAKTRCSEGIQDGDLESARRAVDKARIEKPSIEAALSAQPAERQGEVVPRPMETAPRDGTMLRLLVRFTEHATDDAEEAWTIGSNSFDANGEDEWQFAGWCWTHDHFTEGKGTPIGWLPMHDTHPAAPVGVPKQKTLYDHRVSVDNAARNAGPQLYVALKNLLDAVKERRDNAGIESVVVVDAHNALLAAAPSAPQGEG